MFDDVKLRKCWQQLKSVIKANVFHMYKNLISICACGALWRTKTNLHRTLKKIQMDMAAVHNSSDSPFQSKAKYIKSNTKDLSE